MSFLSPSEGKNLQAGTMALAVFLLFVMSVDRKRWRFRPKKGLCLNQTSVCTVIGPPLGLFLVPTVTQCSPVLCLEAWETIVWPLPMLNVRLWKRFSSAMISCNSFVRPQVQKMESLHWEDLQQNTAREVRLGYRHGGWGLRVLEFILYCCCVDELAFITTKSYFCLWFDQVRIDEFKVKHKPIVSLKIRPHVSSVVICLT